MESTILLLSQVTILCDVVDWDLHFEDLKVLTTKTRNQLPMPEFPRKTIVHKSKGWHGQEQLGFLFEGDGRR